MNKMLVMIAGVLAVVGLIVNVAFDLDNVYDMTTTGLWVLTLVLAFAGAFVGGRSSSSSSASSSATQQFRCSTCGMSFNSASELSEHAMKAHPAPK